MPTTAEDDGPLRIALSGGTTPKVLYALLAQEPYRGLLPWDRMHVFWGDERFVPPDDDRSNYRMAYTALLGHEGVEKALLADFNACRMPHAIIFGGVPGIGKATLAFRLARFLLSQGGEGAPGLFGEPEKPATLHVPPEHPVARRHHARVHVHERQIHRGATI